MSGGADELERFAWRVRGNGRGGARRVLAIEAAASDVAALRRHGFDVADADRAALDESAEHALDGVWFGRRRDVDAAALRASFGALHHGFVRVPVDRAVPGDRPSVELMLERADFGIVEATDAGLVGWTKLVTPKLCAGAVIIDARGRVLLTERADGRGWCMPGGYADPHEAPTSTVVREVREETGLEVEVEGLLGLYSVTLGSGGKIVVCQFFCRVVGGAPTVTDETLDIGWYGESELPAKLFETHRGRLADAFAARRGEAAPPFLRDTFESA